MSNELFGNSSEVDAKEELFTEIFNQIAEQKFGEGDENIQVREDDFSSSPEVTKTIGIQRLLTNEGLQREIYKIVKKQERPKDSDICYLIMQKVNNQFYVTSIRKSVEDDTSYFERVEEDEEIESDRETLTNIARNIKETLNSEVKRLENR